MHKALKKALKWAAKVLPVLADAARTVAAVVVTVTELLRDN
jgi:hypothetical protein